MTNNNDDDFTLESEDLPFLQDGDDEFHFPGDDEYPDGGAEESDFPGSNDFPEDDDIPVNQESQSAPRSQATPQSEPADDSYVDKKSFIKTPLGQAVAGAAFLCLSVAGYSAYNIMKPQPAPYIPEELDTSLPVAEPVDFGFASEDRGVTSDLSVSNEGELNSSSTNAIPAIDQVSFPGNQSLTSFADDNSSAKLDEIMEALSSDRTVIESILESMSKTEARIESLYQIVRDNDAKNAALSETLARLEESLKQAPAPEVVSVSQRVADQPKAEAIKIDPVIGERKRLSDLKVVDVSQSGDMSIIQKVSDGRIFTLFKGEVLISSAGRQTVNSIEKDGDIVLVGSEYYIDRNDPPVRVVRQSVARPPARKPAVSKAPKPPSVEPNFTLNAVFDGGNAFGIVDKSGDFKTYKRGDTLPGVGVIDGLSTSGDLKVGSRLVKPVY